MELKHGTVRLNDAAEWLSKTTGRTFTAADLIDAHDKLPICALIPRSKANPKYSGPVRRAMLAKAVEVEIDAEAARKGPLTQREIVEAAKRRLSKGIATRLEIEKTIHEEGIYLLSRRDLHLLARHGVQRLNRGTPFLSLVASRGFQPGLAEAIEFGTPVDVTADMLCVLKGYLVKFAEQVAAQQVEAPAQMPDPARGQEAEPKAGDVQTHQGQAAEMTPMKRAAIIKSLGRRYPALESALGRPEEWAKACRVPDRQGWYYLERIEAECRTRYGAASPAPAADLSPAGQLRNIGR